MGQFLVQYSDRSLCSPTPPLPHLSLSEADMEEVVPQVEVGLNAHVGFAQGYEGGNMLDPRRS
jgi:hypothetical protein